MSYPVQVSRDAQDDIRALPDPATRLAAVCVALALRDDPLLGAPLRRRARVGDLSGYRRVAFDERAWTGKPRYRLVYRNRLDDAVIEVVQVVAVGLRAQLAVYKAAAARLRAELRRRLTASPGDGE